MKDLPRCINYKCLEPWLGDSGPPGGAGDHYCASGPAGPQWQGQEAVDEVQEK